MGESVKSRHLTSEKKRINSRLLLYFPDNEKQILILYFTENQPTVCQLPV